MEAKSPISDEQRTQDKEKRDKYEKTIKEKIKELHAVKERLYTLRYDYSRPESDIVRDVKNLTTEMQRIDDDINRLRKKELANFEKSLHLGKLGLDTLLTKSKSQKFLNHSSDSSKESVSSFKKQDGNIGFQHVPISTNLENSANSVVDEHDVMDEDEINATEKLMRTQSTQSMKNMNAQQKWHGLFKMFKEWKYQTNVGQASRIVSGNDQAGSVDEEIIKLRSALYAMRQRKNLNKTDQDLMDQMNVKLRGLIKISAELHETERKKSVREFRESRESFREKES